MKRIFIILILLGISFAAASSVQAAGASLYLSPASGTYAVGGSFSIAVKINSGGRDINAAEVVLTFNPNELNIVSISKTGSIFSLWTNEPTFSNSVGNIVFGGGTPSSFNGVSGTIITVIFKAKSNASAKVNFSSGSVLAADGKGTNVLASMTGGTYTIGPKITTPPAEESEYTFPASEGAPGLPEVFSSTHPNPEKWYSNANPEFNWDLPPNITAVKLLIGKKPDAFPVVLYSPPISEKKLEGLADGIWYFHVRFQNAYGWGETLHRKIKIDTEPPEPFKIVVDVEKDLKNPAPVLYFDTSDSLSGVQYYEVKISDTESLQVASSRKTNPYRIPPQLPGTHRVIVEAFDSASNSTSSTAEIIIEALDKPIITEFAQNLKVGDTLTIKGTSSYPNSKVIVFVKKEGEEPQSGEVKTDNEGNWVFVNPESLTKGVYQVWAELNDERGARSLPTDKITIAASLPPLFKIGELAISYLTIIITLLALVGLLVGFIFYTKLKISSWRRMAKKEIKGIEKDFTGAFKYLRKEIEKEIEKLDGKVGLSVKEKKIRDKLRHALKKSEDSIGKEIKDIGRKLK